MKTSVSDFALFGGAPLFPDPLHVGRPNVGDRRRLLERFETMLNRRWLTNDGPFLVEFEQRLAGHLGARHCVATSNATAALELVIRALGLTGEVIVPAFTFVAPVHAIAWLGLTPVFCDIDPRSHLIDPEQVERLVTPRTSGIVAVHLWGRVCNSGRLSVLAARHGLSLIFDGAHALGSTKDGQSIGGEGRAVIFSFHATKIANAFEGGAVATNDAGLADRIRRWRNFGFTDVDQVDDIGVNAKMSEASALMGLTSLESLSDFISVNRRHYNRYYEGLAECEGVSLRAPAAMETTNSHYVVLEIDSRVAHLDRDVILQLLHAEGVLARRYFYPGCHRMKPYIRSGPRASEELVHTDRVCERVLQLPTGDAVEDAQVDAVCELLRAALANSGNIRRRMGA